MFVSTSAVAAHSVFKIPIPCDSESVCHISMGSDLAAMICEADLIICDEVAMRVRYCIEAIDCTLQEIMDETTNLFAGKCILFSGDFRQILPVVPRGLCCEPPV